MLLKLMLLALQIIALPIIAYSKGSFSNNLPIELINKWSDPNYQIIGSEIENPNSPLTKPLFVLKSILEKGTDVNAAVDSIMNISFKPGEMDNIQLKSYYLRVDYLRYLLEHPSTQFNTSFLLRVKSQWIKKYIEGTLDSVNSVLPQYKRISENFFTLWNKNIVDIIDLSPQQRIYFQNQLGKSHGISLDEQMINESGRNQYKVNGFYFSGSSKNYTNILAVDFSLPPGETLITIAHEVVHAADPDLIHARKQLDAMTPMVQAILKKLFPGDDLRKETITRSIVDQVFLELGNKDILLNNFKMIESFTLKKVNSAIENSKEQINSNDAYTLKEWAKLIVQLTIENEYKAYGYSIVAYSQFKLFNFTHISQQRDQFLSSLNKGDQTLAKQIADYMNPFSGNRENKYSEIARTLKNLGLSENEKLTLDRSVNYLEAIYSQEVNTFISGIGNYFKNLIPPEKLQRTIQVTNRKIPEFNSDWTSAGQLQSPLNPYAIITAKLSTYWIVRLKQDMHIIVDQLNKVKYVLLALKSGISDFSNLSEAELKYLGLINPNATTPYICKSDFNYSRPLSPSLESYSKIIPIQGWNNNSVFSNQSLPSQQTKKLLIAMELFHGLSWIDSDFSNLKTIVMASRVLIEKLNDTNQKSNDVTPQRATEMLNEIREALDYIDQNTSVNLNEVNILYDFIIAGQNFSVGLDWISAQKLFDSKRAEVITILELMGFTSHSFNAEASMERWKNSEKSFNTQVQEQVASQCSKRGHGGLFGGSVPINFYEKTMNLNFVCNNSQPYLFHMPCDSNTSHFEESQRTLQVSSTGEVSIGLNNEGRLIAVPQWKSNAE